MQILMDKPFNIADLEAADSLDLRNINEKAFNAVLKSKNCNTLSLYNLRVKDIVGLEELHTIRHLKINWATKIEVIEALEKMRNLENLDLVDLPKLRDITPLSSLPKLTELTLSGGMWKPIHLKTLKPIIWLKLKKLTITNIKLDDDDIKMIAEIDSLVDFDVSNQFPREQYAFLAAKINHRINRKIEAYRKGSVTCPTCSSEKYMFMGRRMPFLCKTCDGDKFSKLVLEFEVEKEKWLRN